MDMRKGLVVGALAGLALPLADGVAAQESGVITREGLDEMVEERARSIAGARAALERFLDRADVREAADGAGLDMERVRSAAGALSDSEVEELRPHLDRAEDALAGGDTFVVSSTAIIIGLLIIILIIVA